MLNDLAALYVDNLTVFAGSVFLLGLVVGRIGLGEGLHGGGVLGVVLSFGSGGLVEDLDGFEVGLLAGVLYAGCTVGGGGS